MKKIIYALLVLLPFISCTEDITENITTGDIAGSVSDQTTGEPVATVNVVLNPGGKSTVTGSDGSFSYKDLEPGKYSLEINKKGYKSNTKEILVKEGETSPTHMLIERIPAIVTADKNLLDFGEEKSINTLSFNIVNSSYEDLSWTIEENCEWIIQVKDQSGTLKYGKTETIVVVIDRSKLESGENTSVIVVKSSNGNTEVRVRAVGEHYPNIDIYEATNVLAYSATLNAKITTSGLPAYSERGFVYSTNTNPSIENCIAKVAVPKNSETKYSCEIKDLELGQTYYARAYAISELGITYSTYSTNFTTAPVLPIVTTQEATDISFETNKANLHGTIVSVGEPAYTECGFVYGLNQNPTINDNRYIINEMKGDDSFHATITIPNEKSIFIRSYAINEAGITYGENVVISTEFIVLTSEKIMVQRKNIGVNSGCEWETAKKICESSRIGGYSDWRLPTINELLIIQHNRSTIGGFTYHFNNLYWSSDKGELDGYYKAFDIYEATTTSENKNLCYQVRAVRTIQ